ncbi:MAG: major capsid protein [Bacteroidales bacterium]|nr:major capsid protein [Bacteroidales bacterium]
MEQSLYFQYAQKYMPELVLAVVEKLNEQNTNSPVPYLYPEFLTTTYTADSTWQGLTARYNRVAADIVALGSPTAPKQRDRISVATGDIPKMSILLSLTEKQMKDIDTMIAKRMPTERVIRAIFADVPRCIDGIRERVEQMFLSGLSTGKALSVHNNGVGAEVDYNFLSENFFKTAVSWDLDTAQVTEDIERLMDKCVDDLSVPTDCFLDDVALRRLYRSKDMKTQFAFNLGFAGDNVPMLTYNQIEQAFLTRYGVRLHRVARRVKTEINGEFTTFNPWKEGAMVFTCNPNLGDLVWTNTAEDTRRDPAALYQNADDFILVSKYASHNPFTEFTKAEAMAVPVINNVEQIYVLNTSEVDSTLISL